MADNEVPAARYRSDDLSADSNHIYMENKVFATRADNVSNAEWAAVQTAISNVRPLPRTEWL